MRLRRAARDRGRQRALRRRAASATGKQRGGDRNAQCATNELRKLHGRSPFFSARITYLHARPLALPVNKARRAGRESLIMAVEVRHAQRDSDFRDLHHLFVDYEADLAPELRHGEVPDAASLKAAFSGEDAAFLAAIENEAIGCVAVTLVDAETARMRHLFVRPARRGLGAARSLVTTSIQFVRRRGYRRFVLDTHKGILRPAYELYRSLGFEECAPNLSVSYPSPTFMELSLAE